MLDFIRQETLTPADASKWLRHVVTEELARIRKDRTLIFADGNSDPQADWAMATAWRMLATRGVNAEVEEEDRANFAGEGRSPSDIHQLDLTLDMLAQDIRSEPRVRKMARTFQELTGREDHLPAAMLLTLRKLLVEGRAAAWEQMPSDQGPQIAAELATSLAQDLLRQEREIFLEPLGGRDAMAIAAVPIDHLTTTVATEPTAPAPLAKVTPPTNAVPASTSEARQSPQVTTPCSSDPVFDPSISAVIERLIIQKSRDGTSSVTQQQYRSFGALFKLITGLNDVRSIRKHHAARFRDVLQQMPKSWGKSPKDAHAPLSAMLTKAKALPPEMVGLAPGTINRHLDHLAQLLSHADDEGINVDDKVKPGKLRVREEKRDRDKRASFRRHELEALFKHTIWQGCKSVRFRNYPGDVVLRDGLYWVPILAAYTGARREELSALVVGDVQVEDGITFLNIVENENRGVKNFSSVRRVPIHDRLIELGFLAHVDKARKRGKDLFPELRPSNHSKFDRKKKYGDTFNYAFTKALSLSLESDPRKLCLHSMRHYARDQLALDIAVPDKVRYDLIGHEMDDVDSRTYGEASPLRALQDAVNRLPIVI